MRLLVMSMAALLLVPATAGAAAAADPAGAVGTTETVPCPSSIVKGAAFVAAGDEVEGKTFSCGVVTVPEDHAKPDGRTIELFYLKLNSTSQSPAPDPLVYLAGGPGSSGSFEVSSNPTGYENMNEIRERRDVIAYDQRGTGYSNYLLCAPFESAIGILQDRDKSPEIATMLKDLKENDGGIGYDALRGNLCGSVVRLLAGVDLGQYNSVVSAKDIASVTDALGYTKGYNLYGTSYGTRLAQYAMRETPDRIRSVVLDGVSPVSTPNSVWSFAKRYESYVALFQQCAAEPACDAAYPDLAARFGKLLTTLEQSPLVFDPPLVVNPQLTFAFDPVLKQIDPHFFVALAGLDNLVMNGGFAGFIPRFIQAAEQGDLEYFRTSGLAAGKPATEDVSPVVPPTGDGSPKLQVQQPLFEAPFQMLLSLAQVAAGQAESGLDSQWISLAVGDLSARLAAGEDQDGLMEALLRLSVVPNTGTTAQQLTDFADAYLSPTAASTADAVVAQMSRNDVRATMWSIQDAAMLMGTSPDIRGDSSAMQRAVNCSDEIAFDSMDQASQYLAQSPYPQLTLFPVDVNAEILAGCVAFPTTLDKSVMEPVTSDIPTLLYGGQLDTQTPVTWAREVAGQLSHALLVEWPNQGHIAQAHDAAHCAGDIAAAFFDDPTVTPDLTCATSDTYKVKFVLPQ